MKISDIRHNIFAKEENLIEVFEFDYEAATKFTQDTVCTFMAICPYPGWIGLPFYYACGKANIKDSIYAQHLCVTKDGIKYVVS